MGTAVKEWKEPPQRSAPVGRYEDLVRELQGRPRQWMHVYTTTPQSAGSVARRLETKYPGVEAVTRSMGDGTTGVFIRWAPAQGQQPRRLGRQQ